MVLWDQRDIMRVVLFKLQEEEWEKRSLEITPGAIPTTVLSVDLENEIINC